MRNVTSNGIRPFCILPARGGSKRFPRKNLAKLGGKPLLAWTIEPALASGVFDHVFVSSENEQILEVAQTCGAAPLPRSADLAGDHVTVVHLCLSLVDEFAARGMCYDAVYVLLPTSPFREAASIRKAWAAFAQSGAGALLSVSRLEHPPEWALRLTGDRLAPLNPAGFAKPRTSLQPAFRHDGAHAIARAEYLRTHGDFLGPDTIAIASTEMEAVDVNLPIDLEWAEFLLASRAVCGVNPS